MVVGLTPVAGALAQPSDAPGNAPQTTPAPPPGPSASDRAAEPAHEPGKPEEAGPPPEGALRDFHKERGPKEIVEGFDEAEALRTEGTKFFKIPGGGAHVAQLFTGPVHYRDADGVWQEIDTSVVPVDGGFENGANDFTVFMPETLTSGVTTTIDGGSLEVTLEGAGEAKARAEERAVTYKGVFKDVDVRYRMLAEGYAEDIVLGSDKARSGFRFLIETTGLELDLLDDGAIEITGADGAVVAMIPPPFAQETPKKEGEPGDMTHDVATSLTEVSPGAYELDLQIDEEWLAAEGRTFPVTLDPDVVTSECPCSIDHQAPLLKDMYIGPGGQRDAYGTSLYAGNASYYGGAYTSYMTFDVRQEIRKVGNLIYRADFDMLKYHHGFNYNRTTFELRRITSDWDETIWPSPPVDSKVWANYDTCNSAGVCEQTGWGESWWRWDVKALMQYWIDTGVPSNHGWAVTGAPMTQGNATASFHSKEAGPLKQPYLYAVVNAMPSTRPFTMDDPNWPYLDLPADAPANGTRWKDNPPVLKIMDLTDANGSADEIVVRYQVSRSATDFSGANLVYSSGWIPEAHQHTVPGSALGSGTYYWRAQASDVCTGSFKDPDEGGANVCDDLSGTTRYRTLNKPERPTSEVRSFILERDVNEHRGTDPRWAQWRQLLGNGMTVTVNQANGNLVLEYPVTALQTAAQPLEVGLSFNSRAAAKNENGPGLAKGWELSAGPGAKPGQLPVRLEPDGTNVVRVVHASGKKHMYVSTDGKTFKTIGPFAGTLRKTDDGSWTLTTYTGGTYVFNSSHDLVKARPSTTTPTMAGFDYNVVNRKLTWVKDPDGRQATFEYNGPNGLLSKILPWGRGVWELGYDTANRVTSIRDPQGNTVELEYDTSGRLSKIRDGVEAAKDNGLSTTVTYLTRDGKSLVSSVTLPGADHAWGFEYNFVNGTINAAVAGTTVTDPRGTKTTGDALDFEITTDFGVNGLPVMSRGPYVPGLGWPVHRWKWDENENLVCSRDAAANAIMDESCNPVGASTGTGALQTEYKYQKRAPYLVTEELSPPSNSSAWDRIRTTYTYDGGMTGIQAQYFENLNLSGLPKKMEVAGNVDYYWPSGGPSGVAGGDGYSARFFGDYVAGHASGTQTYKFKAEVSYTGSVLKGEVVYDDRVRVLVGDTVIIDCWNETLPCQSTGSVGLTPGRHPILVEWADVHSEAKIQLLHETSPGTFQVVPRSSLAPNVDAPTKVSARHDPYYEETTWAYPAGREHLRLPSSRTSTSPFTSNPRTTTFQSDDFGRVKVEAQSATNGRVVKHDYVGACETLTTAGSTTQVMVTTEQTCNSAGDVLTETLVVGNRYDGATDNFLPAQRRTTTMTYDSSGRLETVTNPDGGFQTLEYDDAGRVVKKTSKADATSATGREIRFEYEPEGWLTKKFLPAAAPGEPIPFVDYDHDEVGNRKTILDERSKTWTYTHNSLNRKTTKLSPTGDTWSWTYEMHGLVDVVKRPLLSPTATVRPQVNYDYDVLGRVVSEQLGSNSPTTYKHYPLDHAIDIKDPDGVVTSRLFDVDGNVTQETIPVAPTGTATRTLSYDARGLRVSEQNFRGHATTYTYDALGRLKTVSLPHAGPNTTTYWYNDAGELERVRLPKTGTDTIQHNYDYTVMGYVSKELDGTGNVTEHTYNTFGKRKTTVDPRALTIGYTYDDRGFLQEERVQQEGKPDLVQSFDYDVAGNMLLAQNEIRAVRATYDDSGHLDTVTSGATVSDVDYTIDYDYFGNQVSQRKDDWGAPGGADVDETKLGYNDHNGFLTSVKTPLSPTPATFAYVSSGKLKTRTDPHGLTYTYDYDRAGRQNFERVTNAAGAEIAKFTQTFDKDSHVVERTNTMPGRPDTGTWTYEYDNAGRLTKATDPSGAWTTYDYDGAANRTKTVHSKTNGEGVTTTTTSTTTYDAAGRPEGMTVEKKEGSNAPTTTATDYDHDVAGNLTKVDDGADRWTYGYDAWNRMISSKKALSLSPLDIPVSTTYQYDALDRTVGKGTTLTAPTGDVTVETERSSYDGLGEQLLKQGLTVETPVLTAVSGTTYAYGAGGPIGLSRRVETTLLDSTDLPTVETATRFIGSTLHGDVGFMTDPDGAIVSSKTYDPWGVIRTDEGEKVDLGFQGDQTDEETGLVDMGARYYLPSLGRFTTSDTHKGEPANPLSENRYVYGEADPVSVTDPTGNRVDCGEKACPDHEAFTLESSYEITRKPSDEVVHSPTTASIYPEVLWLQPYFATWDKDYWRIHFTGLKFEQGWRWPWLDGISVGIETADAWANPISGTRDFYVRAHTYYKDVHDTEVPFQGGGRGLGVRAFVCGSSGLCFEMNAGRYQFQENTWGPSDPGIKSAEERSEQPEGFFDWHLQVPAAALGEPEYVRFKWIAEPPDIPIVSSDEITVYFAPTDTPIDW